MNYPPAGEDVEFCPTRANLHWSQTQYNNVEFADFNNLQVAEYGDVKYFQPTPDSEDERNGSEGLNGEGEFLVSFSCLA